MQATEYTHTHASHTDTYVGSRELEFSEKDSCVYKSAKFVKWILYLHLDDTL